ncbi:hypothetical protein Y032_0081g1463 [Ancylostoma ceylanicum]|uniref:ubiquitinyl hydrolase 1 n=1 Tax=Ancylostoma ceylanicum TaxID=53326 RepID=A0A016TT97_9BILA|nr:hypothetical protein Y032_0081g1463 [Ancylostoma ceylanicum]
MDEFSGGQRMCCVQEIRQTTVINYGLESKFQQFLLDKLVHGGSFVAERRESARYKYQLRAVSEHRGVPQSGHFVTYRRGIEDQYTWHLTNDAKVERVPYSQVAAAQAYMLYYERIQPNRWYKQNSIVIRP